MENQTYETRNEGNSQSERYEASQMQRSYAERQQQLRHQQRRNQIQSGNCFRNARQYHLRL